MAQRIYRELSDETKKKISDSMKLYYQSQSGSANPNAMAARHSKIAASQRAYWATIPSKTASDGTNHTAMAQLIGAN